MKRRGRAVSFGKKHSSLSLLHYRHYCQTEKGDRERTAREQRRQGVAPVSSDRKMRGGEGEGEVDAGEERKKKRKKKEEENLSF
ncbi:hypothetical protein JCGZ_01653 [Jatropha curcas]|uniref:Uncharacterized protein n=1 Tax=Jatropha curcas TaxID=180498 RepID=A0A067JGT7_JATCU|nr:hypothetical protein JCGZ_01653 [Jatropha curcas]